MKGAEGADGGVEDVDGGYGEDVERQVVREGFDEDVGPVEGARQAQRGGARVLWKYFDTDEHRYRRGTETVEESERNDGDVDGARPANPARTRR